MCFDLDSHPPIPPLAGAAVDGSRIHLQATDGTSFLAYGARPQTQSGAAMLILPDVRGLYSFYEELALRLAEAGVDSLAIDYFGRTAGVADRPADFDHAPHIGQTHWPMVLQDMQAGRDELAARPGVRAVFSVGFCFGGRLAYLSATEKSLDMAGVIGFYGWPVGPGRAGTRPPAEVAGEMLCPVLGIFGGADQGIPEAHIAQFSAALENGGVDHDLIVYPGAPHSFFDRKAAEHGDAADDAWRHVLEFVHRHTPVAASA